MAKLECQKKLFELDTFREVTQRVTIEMIEAHNKLMFAFNQLVINWPDTAAIRRLETELVRFDNHRKVLKRSLDEWKNQADAFRKEVLDAILDKAKRDKNAEEIATTCVPIKDYVEAAGSEVKSGHALLSTMNSIYQSAESFVKSARTSEIVVH